MDDSLEISEVCMGDVVETARGQTLNTDAGRMTYAEGVKCTVVGITAQDYIDVRFPNGATAVGCALTRFRKSAVVREMPADTRVWGRRS